MGNVFASSLAQPPMPGTVPPPNLPEQTGVSKGSSSSDKNPGTIEELHKKCKGKLCHINTEKCNFFFQQERSCFPIYL